MLRLKVIFLAVCIVTGLPSGGRAQHEGEGSETWRAEKCRLYAEAWQQARARRGNGALTPGFIAANDEFIARGCGEKVPVCPRSPADFDMANVLTIRAMNAGMASTFLPFACPKTQ